MCYNSRSGLKKSQRSTLKYVFNQVEGSDFMKTMFLLIMMVVFFAGMLRYEVIDGKVRRAVAEFGFVASSIVLGAAGIVIFLTCDGEATMAESYTAVVDVTIIAGIVMFSLMMWLNFCRIIMSDEEQVLRRTTIVFGTLVFAFGSWIVAEKLQQLVKLEDFTEFGVIFIGVSCAIIYIIVLHRISVIGGNIRAMWLETCLERTEIPRV